jgi:hypothetical protein
MAAAARLPGRLEKKITEDLGGLDKFKADFAAAGVGSSAPAGAGYRLKNGKLEISKTCERREPAGPWRHADPRLRRLGALLLHRLSSNRRPDYLKAFCDHLINWELRRRAVRHGPELRHSGAMRSIEPGISRFSDAQLRIGFAASRRPGMTAK